MTFYINAWLDRVDPFISLHNRHTGEEVVRFEKNALQECLEQGDFCLNEFCNPCQRMQQELVKCLLLTQCAHSVRCQLEGLLEQCVGNCEVLTPPRQRKAADILPFRRTVAAPVKRDVPRFA